MRYLARALRQLDAQLGTISRRQLFAAGHTRAQVDAMVRHGHLQRVGHGVYRRPGSGTTRVQQAMAALLRCGAGARITGELVLALLGCEGYDVEAAAFTLLLPPGRRVVNVDFATRTDQAPRRHVARYGPLRATTPARTLAELAVDLREDGEVVLAADRLRWRTGTGGADLARVAADLAGHPGMFRLRRLGLLVAHRPESPGERGMEDALGDLVPPLEWQVHLAPDLRVDALWRDRSIVIEYAGRDHHDAPRDRERDAARDRRIEALGYLVVHVTAEDLRYPEQLRDRLHRLREERLARHDGSIPA